jgi:amino acid transporter
MPEPPPRQRVNPVVSGGRVSHYRVELPHAGIVPTERNRFEATEYAERRTGLRGAYLELRDTLVGTTLSSHRLEGERLSKVKALAVFSSDALSSVAYATQEILFVLVLAGAGAMNWSLPIAIGIASLLAIVVISYRQTVRAYSNGGGSYIVAHENLGVLPGLVAASALLIDYVLTVAVSVAAGMDALASLHEGFRPWAVPLAVGIVVLVTLINLRGVTESATIFAIPTYAFIVTLSTAIVVVLVKVLLDGNNPFAAGEPREPLEGAEALTIFLVLRAFANGCTAMSGIEAVSNGVQAFKQPAARNAGQTLAAMAMLLAFMFVGLTVLARHFGFVPHENSTIPSQLGAEAFGDGTFLFGFLQLMTAGILLLAANTAFAGFPRLAAILARDGYVPRIFHARGNRLVFSYGIVTLAGVACLLLVVFNATTTRLIPLYALGVFLGFTLSQAGMVRHWLRTREAGWRRSAVINGVGTAATFIVLLVILEAKFFEGAYLVVLLIPVLTAITWLIGSFYRSLARNLRVPAEAQLDLRPHGPSPDPVIIPVEEVNLATVMALAAACERSRDVTAVHVLVDPDEPSTVEARWHQQFPSVPLVVIDSPYRTVAEPIAVFVDDRLRRTPGVTVIVPTIEVRRWYQRPLVNQTLKRLVNIIGRNRHVTLVMAPYFPGGTGRRSRDGRLPPAK